jgi:hypothetical protein
VTKIIALALCLALSTAGTVAAADGTDTTAAPAAKPVKKEKPKRICKNDPRVTGTRISKRICKTEEEWAKKEDGQEVGVRSKTSRADMENVGGLGQP